MDWFGQVQIDYKIPSELLCAVLMNGEVGSAIIAQRVKIAFQPPHSSIRANWEFSSNCAIFQPQVHMMFSQIDGSDNEKPTLINN